MNVVQEAVVAARYNAQETLAEQVRRDRIARVLFRYDLQMWDVDKELQLPEQEHAAS